MCHSVFLIIIYILHTVGHRDDKLLAKVKSVKVVTELFQITVNKQKSQSLFLITVPKNGLNRTVVLN